MFDVEQWNAQLRRGLVELCVLAAIYVGATTAFMLHGIWHWLTHGYRVREPEPITGE